MLGGGRCSDEINNGSILLNPNPGGVGRVFAIDDKSVLFPTIYDVKLENAGGTQVIDFPNYSISLLDVLTSEAVYFDGPNARAANGGNRVSLFAPATYDQGSSISHLAETYNGTADALMTYSLPLGESIHDPGTVAIGILEDLGWPINQNCFPTYVYVNKQFLGPEQGTIINPYRTLEKAHQESTNGSTIFFLSQGVHDEPNGQVLNRKVLLRLANGGIPVIIR